MYDASDEVNDNPERVKVSAATECGLIMDWNETQLVNVDPEIVTPPDSMLRDTRCEDVD